MRFALLGTHPDGLEMAAALVESGRHHMVSYSAASVDPAHVERWTEGVRRVNDLEEVLSDPSVDMVLVASGPANRPVHLRRALQSERHVLCVYPPDHRPDIAYEAAMMRQDTRCLLLPLLPDAFHPALVRLKDLTSGKVMPALPAAANHVAEKPAPALPHGIVKDAQHGTDGIRLPRPEDRRPVVSPAGVFRLIEFEQWDTGEVLHNVEADGQPPSFPGWDVLRALGGEIAEVSALTVDGLPEAGEPVLLAGRFERGGLFQATLLPRRPEPLRRLRVFDDRGHVELLFPLGTHGPAFLSLRGEDGESREESWDPWDPWPTMVAVMEENLSRRSRVLARESALAVTVSQESGVRRQESGAREEAPTASSLAPEKPRLTWQDAIRCLELDDAARRSALKRRSSLLEYPEASEEVSFKGTMTLIGCGLLWAIILLTILSRWVPWLGWAVGPVLALFLLLQLLRWFIPRRDEATPQPPA